MKIYQLHEYGGEYEDHYDYIIGSYLRKKRAEEEKTKAEAKEKELREHHKRCNSCPFIETQTNLLNSFPNYCSEARLEETECGIDCENFYLKWDESIFKIEIVEVEE